MISYLPFNKHYVSYFKIDKNYFCYDGMRKNAHIVQIHTSISHCEGKFVFYRNKSFKELLGFNLMPKKNLIPHKFNIPVEYSNVQILTLFQIPNNFCERMLKKEKEVMKQEGKILIVILKDKTQEKKIIDIVDDFETTKLDESKYTLTSKKFTLSLDKQKFSNIISALNENIPIDLMTFLLK